MFFFNLNNLLRSKAIEHPHAYLVSLGIDPSTASDYLRNKRKSITLRHLELICVNTYCTPNDITYWAANEKENMAADHPLQKLKDPALPYLLTDLKQLSPAQIRAVQKAIDEIRKAG